MGNIPHPEVFSGMSRLVREQRIGREEFALAYVEHEFNAMQDAARYFSLYPIPDATSTNAPIYSEFTDGRMEHCNFRSYVAYLDTLGDADYDPREYFAQWHDQLRAHYFGAAASEPSHATEVGWHAVLERLQALSLYQWIRPYAKSADDF